MPLPSLMVDNDQMSVKFITISKAGVMAICLTSFGAQAGIASRIASEVAPIFGPKVTRKAINEQNKDKPPRSEFERLSNAIPADLTEKQGKSASALITVVYRYRLGDTLPLEQRVSQSDFKILTARFSEKVSKIDKTSIEPVIKLHMFCQQQTELYIESFLPSNQERIIRDASQTDYADNLRRCSARMNQLPGIPSDFSIGYSDILKKFESSEVKAGLTSLKLGDSTLINVSLMVKGLKSVRELMDKDFQSIFLRN